MPNGPSNRTIVALDPGTREMGYASFESGDLIDYGIMSIRQGRGARDILTDIDRRVTRLLKEKQPSVLVFEKNSFSQIRQNGRLTLALARLKTLGTRAGAKVYQFDPRTIRKIVCNDGNATKREVARTLAVSYPELRVYLKFSTHSASRYWMNCFDAIAAGVAYHKSSQAYMAGWRRPEGDP